MQFWRKCKRFINGVFMTFMTLITLGAACGILLTSILVLMRYPLTEIDTSILAWLIVAFCISVVALFYALINQFSDWKYSKLIMGIIFSLFDILLLFLAILLFTFRSNAIAKFGELWTSTTTQSAIVQYFEDYFKCCGFDENTNIHCGSDDQIHPKIYKSDEDVETPKPLCLDEITSSLNTNANFLGSIIIALFALLLFVIILTFINAYRQLKRPEDPELTDIQGQLNSNDVAIWF